MFRPKNKYAKNHIGFYRYSKRKESHCNQILIQKAPFKTLGIWFSDNDGEMAKLNFEKKIEKMENLTNTWRARHLSLKAKVTIIKSLILPQVTHLLSMCYCPQTMLEKIDKVLLFFMG